MGAYGLLLEARSVDSVLSAQAGEKNLREDCPVLGFWSEK
jgi:hypothetical protein